MWESPPGPRKRIWVQQIDPELNGLRIRLAVARTRALSPAQQAAANGVECFIDRAEKAANRMDPIPGRVRNWWRGTLVEASYRNLHLARVQMLDLLTEAELNAEVPGIIARAHSTLSPDDPRLLSSAHVRNMPVEDRRAWLRRLMEDGYDVVDTQHTQLRNFRNILLKAGTVITVLLVVAVVLMSARPSWIPLCFPYQELGDPPTNAPGPPYNCPTAANVGAPQKGDVWVVGLIGLFGGALGTSIAIRKMKGGSPIPYDVPVALAWFKVPLGAFASILGIVAIRGGFVPGLTQLDSQEQILAYALLFGFSQQLLTQLLDSKAQSVVAGLPTKDTAVERGHP